MNTILTILFLLFFYGFSYAQVAKENPSSEVSQRIQSVSFTLENTTNKTIPLFIPSVMNPNLSPNSQSGVTLNFGQKVIFKYRGKKRILLVIDESIIAGEIVDVAALIEQQKSKIDSEK